MNKDPREHVVHHIALTMLGVVALCSTAAYATGPTPKPMVTNDWFDVSFTSLSVGTTIANNSTTGFTLGAGSWTSVPSDGVAEVVSDTSGTCLSIDADIDDLLALTPVSLASVVCNETVSMEINAPAITALPDAEDLPADPVTMFSLFDNGSTVTPIAYVAGVWTNLVYTPGAQNLTNAWFTLYLDFANENGAKFVRYSVQPSGGVRTVLQDSTGETWFPSSSASKTSISGLAFSGTALCRAISGDYNYDEVIKVNGSQTITLTTNLSLPNLSITNVTAEGGIGTLTISSENDAKLIVGNLDIGEGVVVNMANIEATTITGVGTAAYTGVVPPTGKGWTDSAAWKGTVWIKNCAIAGLAPGDFANASSTLRLSMCTGYFNDGDNTKTCDGTLDLQNDTGAYAFSVDNGWSANGKTIFAKLTGSGTLGVQTRDIAQRYIFKDASEFTGAINLAGRPLRVIFGDGESLSPTNGSITVASGATVTVPSGKTWTAKGGFVIDGTLNVNGTLSSSHATKAVSGSGTVVFTGRAPTPTGNAWWTNSDWDGTVQVKNVTNMVGDSREGVWLKFNDYGNIDSVVEVNDVTGWLTPAYTCTPKLKITGTLTLNNGNSGKSYAFKVGTLLGGGKIKGSGSAGTVVFNVTDDSSGFTGAIDLDNKCVVFGETIPDAVTAGTIYVSDGAVATIHQPSEWYPDGGVVVDEGGVLDVATGKGYINTSAGIVVNGTVKAMSPRQIWGGIGPSTPITINSTGVLELTSTSDINDSSFGTNPTSVDLSRITGTGTLKYSSTAGWRAFPDVDAKMPASTLTLQTELYDSLIITKTNGTTVVGNLAGSKNIRSDFGTTGENGRILTVTQSKDTEWQGKFVSNRLTQFNVVAHAEGTPGTLTLSGTQEASIPMQVDGSVNLTGTWVGATTVAGTFGGTGTLTGNLTFSAGSTFKAFATDADGLSVSGTVAYPESGTVTVDISGITVPKDGVTLITGGTVPSDTSKLSVAADYVLRVESNALKVYPAPEAQVDIANVVTDEWKTANGLPTDATDEQIRAKMRESDANGNAKWQNLVIGQNGSESVAVVAATNGTETTAVIGLTFTPPADSGYTVTYAFDKVDTNGNVIATTEQATPSIDLTQITAPTCFKIRAVLTNEYVDSSVPVEKIIGVTKVDSTSEYTIVGVPWASFDGGDIKVSELLHVGNRSAGDVLMAYNSTSKDYKTGTWTLSEAKVWEPTTVTKENESGESESGTATAADQNTIKRGSGVWLKRVNKNAPIYLLGQVTNATATVSLAARESETEPSWNLVASPSAEALDLNAVLKSGPTADDQIKVPTAGAPIDYTYKDGAWGYMKATKDSNGIIQKTWTTEGAIVPAGCGFWYLNTSSGSKNLNL